MKIEEFLPKLSKRYPTINVLYTDTDNVHDMIVVDSDDSAWLFEPNGNMDITRTSDGICKYLYEWVYDRGWHVEMSISKQFVIFKQRDLDTCKK